MERVSSRRTTGALDQRPAASQHRPQEHASSATLALATSSPLIDEKQLCAELGISSVTATKWRAKAAGPPFIKVGRLVRYRRADVDAWLASRTVGRRSG
jgi:predicted DNA-binding transcriptional regulator AlpA